jgi:hypothetical protein
VSECVGVCVHVCRRKEKHTYRSQKCSCETASGTSRWYCACNVAPAARRRAAEASPMTPSSSTLARHAANSALSAGTRNVASTRCSASSSFYRSSSTQNALYNKNNAKQNGNKKILNIRQYSSILYEELDGPVVSALSVRSQKLSNVLNGQS